TPLLPFHCILDFGGVTVSYSQKLTTILLNEFNYLPWSRAITIALDGRSRLGFISGKNTNPGVTSPEYEAWLPKDQMLDIANLRQDGNSFVNLLGKLKGLWNELEVYRPHSVDPKFLRKRHEDDQSVCATIQREEIRRKVMINDATTPEARVYYANASLDKKPYKGKHSDLKCGHCNVPGHSMNRCWILNPELKLNFTKDKKGFIDKRRVTNPKAHMATHTTESFSSSPV
ncbi:retrovirus-related pol polyprotein from transposon RE2, partial [Tanacetum coccineum]